MRVAFSLLGNNGWTGGSHYLKNLLRALHELPNCSVEPVLFVGHKDPQQEIDALNPYVTDIVHDSSYTRWSSSWIMSQTLKRVISNDIIIKKLFNKHRIDVVFHSGLFGNRFPLPSVNWIADFQHIHLPEMFSSGEKRFRDKLFSDFARMSKRIVVSSECAKNDLESFLPDYRDRIEVLKFVAQLPTDVYNRKPSDVLQGYQLPEKYFHLPNQLWKHKNHLVVIGALRLLKNRGYQMPVICTGNLNDYRNPDFITFLKKEIRGNELEETMILKGMVPLDHLYALMRQSIAILNPSLFEGWSTTVEEAKSLGKQILLSDISVHREQNPPGGLFFDPKNPEDLADKMLTMWEKTPPGPDYKMEEEARLIITERVHSFARTFVSILNKAVSYSSK